MADREVVSWLRGELPAGVVDDTPAGRYRASMDNLRLSVMPAAVVVPTDEEQVGIVLRLANEKGFPVTPRGAGSATTGAATPFEGGVVLDLAGLRRLHIEPLSQLAYAQAGVTLGQVDAAARQHGLMFAPDPGSKEFATVGGAISTNAGGLRGARYGVMRDYVVAVEGYLPTGAFVRWSADLRKFASGYNLRDLWVGAEGTLGVITGAVLRLVGAPTARRTFLAGFADEATALATVAAILSAQLNPAILEFLDGQTMEATRRFLARKGLTSALLAPFMEPLQVVLLVELDGTAEGLVGPGTTLGSILATAAHRWAEARTSAEAEELWSVRRRCSQAMFELGPHKLNEDVVVPLAAQRPLLEYTRELRERTGLPTPTFGHAADGNFHVHLMYDAKDEESRRRAAEGVAALMAKVVELGGAISGEHGIGLAKTPFLRLQHSEAEIAAMRALKGALDPRGILNPGKIFTPVEVWRYPREEVHLPWDH